MSNLKPFNKPNFFILGAAKSGTTSVYKYLKGHPEVFLSKVKEPTFFCEDFQLVSNPITYFELFDKVDKEKCIGEASHGYLSDPKVPQVLKALFADSKFILIFRNPAERAFSLYNHMRRIGYETINTFEKALEAENSRLNSEKFRKTNPQYFHNFLYFNSGKYGEQINRYLSLFDRSQFIFLNYHDLIVDPQSQLNKICDFLEVDPITLAESDTIHKNKGYNSRSILLEKLIRSDFLKKKTLKKYKIKQRLQSLNHYPVKPMKDSTRTDLMLKYSDDLAVFYKQTGIKFD